mgnify:CR=1 FL=1
MVKTAFLLLCFWVMVFDLFAQPTLPAEKALHIACKHPSQQQRLFNQLRHSQSTTNLFKGHILKQKLHLNLDPTIRYISGFVDYSLLWANQVPVFRIDIGDAIKDSSRLAGNTAVVLLNRPGTPTVVSFPNQLEISLPFALNPNDTLQFRIYFQGEPYDDGNSFGSFRTATHGPNNSPVLWTLSQPYGAKDWWPNFQVLGQKADTTEMIITTPPGYYAGGMGLLQNIDSSGSSWIHHWQHNYPCPPYLIGTAVSDYWVYDQKIAVNNGLDSIAVLNYLYAEDSVSWKIMLDGNLPPMLQLFTELFGEYPFINEKYGHMQISNGDGGMEHNTMSSMGSYDYSLMAHELAHMWFGNKITCLSWQDIWINEGFASWMTGLTLERLLDNGYWWEPWKRLQRESALSSQNHKVFKQDTNNVAALFQNRSTYHKASMVIHQLRYQLGDSALFAGVYNYITDPNLAYGFATTQSIKNHLEFACNCNLTTYFDQWIYNSAHPEYRISWSAKNQGISLFIEDLGALSPAGGFDLDLPFRVFSANGDSVELRITERGNTIYAFRELPFVPVRVVFDPEIQVLAELISLERAAETLQVQHISGATSARVVFPADWEGKLNRLELYDLLGRRLYVVEGEKPLFSLDLPYYLLGGSLSGLLHARHPDGRVAVARFHDMRSR